MRFAHPDLLWLLLLAPLLATGFVLVERRRRRALAAWFSQDHWSDLLAEHSRAKRRGSAAILCTAVLLLVLGAARPQLGSKILETRQRGIDIVVAVDLSLSMLARDVAPSRLERARTEVLALLDRFEGDRVALVTFAGEAFLQSPLTLDRGAIRMLLPLLSPDAVAEPGSNLAEAIRRSQVAFRPDPERGRALILLTDGEAHQGDFERAVAEAKDARIRICAIGIGRTEGEPIPVSASEGSGEYKKDRHGRIVVTRLEEDPLRRACAETGGTYVRAGAGSASTQIHASLRDLKQGEVEGGLGIRYEERYTYFAALAFAFLLLEGLLGERRRR